MQSWRERQDALRLIIMASLALDTALRRFMVSQLVVVVILYCCELAIGWSWMARLKKWGSKMGMQLQSSNPSSRILGQIWGSVKFCTSIL